MSSAPGPAYGGSVATTQAPTSPTPPAGWAAGRVTRWSLAAAMLVILLPATYAFHPRPDPLLAVPTVVGLAGLVVLVGGRASRRRWMTPVACVSCTVMLWSSHTRGCPARPVVEWDPTPVGTLTANTAVAELLPTVRLRSGGRVHADPSWGGRRAAEQRRERLPAT